MMMVGGAGGLGGAKRTSCSRPVVCIGAPARALAATGIGVNRTRGGSERPSAVLGSAASRGAKMVEDTTIRFRPLRVNTSYDSSASAIELPRVFHYSFRYPKRPFQD